jgi:hypothetical protein
VQTDFESVFGTVQAHSFRKSKQMPVVVHAWFAWDLSEWSQLKQLAKRESGLICRRAKASSFPGFGIEITRTYFNAAGRGGGGWVVLLLEDRVKHLRVDVFFRLEKHVMNLFSVTFCCVVLPALGRPMASCTSGCW